MDGLGGATGEEEIHVGLPFGVDASAQALFGSSSGDAAGVHMVPAPPATVALGKTVVSESTALGAMRPKVRLGRKSTLGAMPPFLLDFAFLGKMPPAMLQRRRQKGSLWFGGLHRVCATEQVSLFAPRWLDVVWHVRRTIRAKRCSVVSSKRLSHTCNGWRL